MEKFTKTLKDLNITSSELEGQELREAVKVWQELAASETRIIMMRKMISDKIGFTDLEEMNQEIISKFKSSKFKGKAENNENLHDTFKEPVMKSKLADEQNYMRELRTARTKYKRMLGKKFQGRVRQYKNLIKYLRQEARIMRQELTMKYKKKIAHIKEKYRRQEKEIPEEIPADLEEYAQLSVFSKEKYDKITPQRYDPKVIGEVEISEEEKAFLRLHPKFAVRPDLHQGGLEDEQEFGNAKMRMEISRQEGEEYDEKEDLKQQECEARTRQIFNPEDKTFDGRKCRVTDLRECSRVFLPRPLDPQEESRLEARKQAQTEIYEKYRREFTNKNNKQESNLTRIEQEGLKILEKRTRNNEIIVMKTDKSGRFVVTNEQEYKKMGQEHTEKDLEITMREVHEMEKACNDHTRAWSYIWQSGDDHDHLSRIISSKNSRSGNEADLTLLFKDHKEGNKTRPVATGNTSYTLGLSNCVSEILESVASVEKNKYASISSEDMLAKITSYNTDVLNRREDWEHSRLRKLNCKKCNVDTENKCEAHKETMKKITNITNIDNINNIKETLKNIHEISESECCKDKINSFINQDCEHCGKTLPSKRSLQTCVIGNDVVALFPSIQAESTGEIIRDRIERSEIEFEGFDDKIARVYIALNREKTGNLEELEYLLPTRKNPRSTKLTMASIKADYNPEKQWIFPTKVLDKTEIKQVVARVVEIATRTLFENFSYKFEGKHFKQKKGGPIGVRATGSAAELVMQDWSEKYLQILQNSELWVGLLSGYVDDGRQACSILEKGMRFSEQENKFSFSKEAELEDARLEKMGESKNQRMARVCQPAMNSINPDLVFTVESQEDFEKERLPTLDFEIWQMEDGTLNHSYFQKQMKTPYVIMARSAMPIQQKIQILGNELTRRLSNVNKERVGKEKILENY